MTLLICTDGLIGDFLGILPLMIELAKQDDLHVRIHPEAEHLFNLIPKKYNIKLQDEPPAFYDRVIELDISQAFDLSSSHNYYMSQSHFAYLGMPVPSPPPKAELEFDVADNSVYDYLIAPFSRSLPLEQRWPRARWQRLVELMPDHTFCIIGHNRDERNFIAGDNVIQMYNEEIVKVMSVLVNSRGGLISVVSGPSHLAFHLGVNNYLLTNQNMTWGNNPDAITICDYIPDLKAEKLVEILNSN